MLTKADRLRSQLSVNDTVSFQFRGQVLYGTISRLNPKRAHVVCEDDDEYQVPYALVNGLEIHTNAAALNHSETELASIATRAKELMADHDLNHWSFQFDSGTKRAGGCHYGNQVISLSLQYAQHATEYEITDTLLHEIAHALVGKAHSHDAVWQAKATEIGCSGRRCHDTQFTLPRYIIRCENQCWIATAERRRRGRICRNCQGKIIYSTYTQARWNKEQARI